jgi:hypothetical protein
MGILQSTHITPKSPKTKGILLNKSTVKQNHHDTNVKLKEKGIRVRTGITYIDVFSNVGELFFCFL